MTKEECNKLIAVFMGEDNLTKVQHLGYNISVGRGKKATVEATKLVPYVKDYSGSWDRLMPVVEKIDDLGYETTIQQDGTAIQELTTNGRWVDVIDFDEGQSRIDNTWKAVISFLQWYNLQN